MMSHTREIRDVAGQSRPQTSHGTHAGQLQICVHAARKLGLEVEESAASASLADGPAHGRNGSDRCGEELGHEQIAETSR